MGGSLKSELSVTAIDGQEQLEEMTQRAHEELGLTSEEFCDMLQNVFVQYDKVLQWESHHRNGEREEITCPRGTGSVSGVASVRWRGGEIRWRSIHTRSGRLSPDPSSPYLRLPKDHM